MRLPRCLHLALWINFIWVGGAVQADHWSRHPRSLAVAPDGVTVAAACGDKAVRIWNTTDGKLIHQLSLDNPGRSVTYIGRDGDLAVGDEGGVESTVGIWKHKDGKYSLASRTKVYGVVVALAASPDGKWVVAVTVYGHIYFIDAKDGAMRRAWQESGNGIHDVAFSPDGKTLYTAGQAFRAWDVKAEELPNQTATLRNSVPADERERDEKKYLRFQTGNATSIALLPGEGRVIAVGWFANQKGTASDMTLFEGPKWEKKTLLSDAMGDATFLAISPDGMTMIVGFNSDRLEVWDIREGRKATLKRDGIGQLRAGIYLGDGKRLVIANDDCRQVEVIEAMSGKLVTRLSR